MVKNERLNRRRFLGAGGLALTVAAVPLSWALTEDSATPYRAIYDERFKAGHVFSAEAAQRGWTTRAIRGDITQVWYRELAPRWRHGPAAIAGVTTAQSLFVLERLAWDARMRVTFRDIQSAEPLVRWVISVPPRSLRS